MTTHAQTHTTHPRRQLRVITPQTTTPPLFSRRELRRLVAEMID